MNYSNYNHLLFGISIYIGIVKSPYLDKKIILP